MIAIYGATGYTGRQVVDEVRRRGHDAVPLTRADAGVGDADGLTAAIAGSSVVINCAGPFAGTAEPLVAAAVDAGVHYLDITAEQPVAQALFASWDAPARAAGIAVVPAMGFYGGLGDLLAADAAAGLENVDRLTVAYAVDNWLLTQASRDTAAIMREGRGDVPPRFGTFAYPAPIGDAPVMEDYPLPEAVSVPRHVPAREVRVVMAAATLQEILAPDAPAPGAVDDAARARSRFTIVADAERAGDLRRTVARGQDIYGITAPIVVQAALALIDAGPTGALSPAQAFPAPAFLEFLADRGLELERS